MKRKRYTTEQIIAILRQADTSKTVQEVCHSTNVSEQTIYHWGKKYSHLELADAKRYKELGKRIHEHQREGLTHRAEEAARRFNAQEPSPGGNTVKKEVSPKQKKRAVKDAAEKGLVVTTKTGTLEKLVWVT